MRVIKWCAVLVFVVGCAHVRIDSKEPIKLNVNMRVDVYQHVARDVDAIEDMIAGPQVSEAAFDKTSLLDFFVPVAYAQKTSRLPDDVMAAIERRRGRRPRIILLESQGYIGESSSGFIDVFDKISLDATKLAMVEEENDDRLVIFEYVARKNGTSVEETGKIFAGRIQQDAAAGTPIEESPGGWVVK
jgi:uncharacterized protein YdbL (DUF1318 family)